ncbi:phosphoglucosamine mutase [Thermodesulfobacterium sp. TA1]|uniref:phosphoglucosamine mutase n=1 Tax=Thermodesulfobacterium sp. TA1 TaxID=2234087 RepID=UPI0012323644|nr:phosphoglucosamine mutase [Thermodesulfobacterium sp. TA1]QER42151.1 phosphoglucosamine mutase [Thermodesulfobacterium sp. TA1]
MVERKLFGTDGIRGEANFFPMLPEIALQVGRAIGFLFKNQNHHTTKVVIGKDTRLSGYVFESALVAGICSMGGYSLLVGPIPTPGIAFLTKDMRADAGIMISASHNPYYDNGIKIFGKDGFKLSDETEAKIEELIFDEGFKDLRVHKDALGRAFRIKDAIGRYVVHLKSVVPSNVDFEGLKVVIDCANGACYQVGPRVLEELGAEVIAIGCNPNGININEKSGALYPENIQKAVLENQADLGIALDGDGDRIVVVDEKGNLLDGDDLLAIFAIELKEKVQLTNLTVVGTIMSNLGLELFLKKEGINFLRTPVGDRYVVMKMREVNAVLGGETSGHIIFLDKATTGDGLLAGLRLLSLVKQKEKPLSELAKLFEKLPQVIKNIKVSKKIPLDEIEGIQEKIKQAEDRLGKTGRIVIRPSGTEPKYRIMVEGENPNLVEEISEALKEFLQKKLG